MLFIWVFLLLVTTFQGCSSKFTWSLQFFGSACRQEHYFNAAFCGSVGFSRGAQDVVLSKNEALSFHKRFIDDNIDEECYGEESCDFEEVVEKFGHSEQSVGTPCYLNKNGALEYVLLK